MRVALYVGEQQWRIGVRRAGDRVRSSLLGHAQHVAQIQKVVLHRPLGAGGVAALHGAQQGAVLVDDGGVHDGPVHLGHELGLEHLEDPPHERLQHPVPRRGRHRAVDLGVGVAQRLGVVLIGHRLRLDRGAQPGLGLVVGVVGGQAGQRRLQDQARVQELLERGGPGLQHHRDGVAEADAHALVGGVLDEDAPAGALVGTDQVSAGQNAQRLTQRRPADAEVLGQVLLAAQEVARRHAVGLDRVLDLDGHLLAGAADPLPA